MLGSVPFYFIIFLGFALINAITDLGNLPLSNGLRLHTRLWKAKRPKGKILLVHGYSWHSAYFQQFAENLSGNQFDVYSVDLPGHGLSDSFDGIRVYILQFSAVVDTIEERS
jgi:alpha-beta hydrolase superfamily lysophospholipase